MSQNPNRLTKVHKPVARQATVDVSVGSEDVEKSPAHCTIAKGQLKLRSEDFDLYEDMPCLLLPSSSFCPTDISV